MQSLIHPYDLLLDATTGWRVKAVERVAVTEGRLALQTLQSMHPPLADLHGSFGGYAFARGAVLWHDTLFVADPARHRILQWQPCWTSVIPLKTIGGLGTDPRQLNTPAGMALSGLDDLVVVDSGNRRLQLFTLPGLGLRRIIGPFPARPGSLPESHPDEILPDLCSLPLDSPPGDWWHPVDVARAPQRGLFVADRRGWIWKLDSRGRPDPHYDGRLPAGCIPVRVAADSSGGIYLVCQEASASSAVLRMLDRYGKLVPMANELLDAVKNWLALHISDLALPDPRPATYDEESTARGALLPPELSSRMDEELRLFLIQEMARRPEPISMDDLWDELRNHAYDDLLPGAYDKHLPAFLQMTLADPMTSVIQANDTVGLRLILEGNEVMVVPEESEACPPKPMASGLHVDEAGYLILPDTADGPYLIYRPPIATFPLDGYVQFELLDSERNNNLWHRVAMEIQSAERTSVRLFAFTSDVARPDLKAVDAGVDLLAEPPQLGSWMSAPPNAPEWLVQNPPGRYLYLTLVLRGPGDRTPQVERLYVYSHRHSSLSYLPAIFQTEPTSRQILDRLLSLYDTIWSEIETKIEDLPRLLDPLGAPPEYLPWLASWFELMLEQSWSVAQRRAFTREAVDLFRWRGTIRGLRRLLQLHLGLENPMPRIIENYRSQGHPSLETWLGQPPEGDAPNHFTIAVPAGAWKTPDQRRALTLLVDAFIPAHTHFSFRVMHPGILLGSETLRASVLGVDSILSNGSMWRLPYEDENLMPEPESILGAGLILPAMPMPRATIRLGFTRLGATPK